MSGNVLSQLTTATKSDSESLAAVLSFVLRQHEIDVDGLICCQVTSFDRVTNKVNVKPMITWVGIDDTPKPRQEIIGLTAISIGAGGFHISFPINEGDLGWIFAVDRDIDLFIQELKEAPPNTGRIKQFSSAIFIPDVFFKYEINDEDASAMVIQSTDSSTRISIRGDNIKITAPTKVVVDTPETEFTGNVSIKGNSKTDGSATVEGLLTANGGFEGKAGTSCTLPANATVGGINVTAHYHIEHDGPQTSNMKG